MPLLRKPFFYSALFILIIHSNILLAFTSDDNAIDAPLNTDLIQQAKKYESKDNSRSLYDLDTKQTEYIVLNSPHDKLTSIKDKILIKGMFLKNGKVLVNEQVIPIKAGRFTGNITLPGPGKYLLRFDFVDNDNNMSTIYRRIFYMKDFNKQPIRRFSPKALESVLADKKNMINAQQPVSRELLAKILVLSEKIDLLKVNPVEFIDVPFSYEYAPYIRAAVTHELLPAFPDGTYRPKEFVTNAQMLVLAAGYDKLDTSGRLDRQSFSDVPLTHWAAPAIQSALKSNLISSANLFAPNDTPSVRALIDLLSRIPDVQVKAKPIVDFESGFNYEPKSAIKLEAKCVLVRSVSPNTVIINNNDRILKVVTIASSPTKNKTVVPSGARIVLRKEPLLISTPIIEPELPTQPVVAVVSDNFTETIPDQQEVRSTYSIADLSDIFPDVIIRGLRDKYIATKQRLVIKGSVLKNPSRYFLKINGKSVNIGNSKRFIAKVDLPPGRLDINIDINNKIFVLKVKRMTSFKDIKPSYWCYKTIQNLLLTQYFLESDRFNPTGSLTRKELAFAMNRIFDFSQDKEAAALVKDVPKSGKYNQAIFNVLNNNLMYLDESGNFNPEGRVKKAEVIVSLISLFQIEENAKIQPYKDVPLDHYAVDEIACFKQHGIISGSDSFYPESYITRAQFAALISKLPKVKEEIDNMDKW